MPSPANDAPDPDGRTKADNIGLPEPAPTDTADRAAASHEEAAVDEADEESFPASDPPSTWSGPDAGDP